MAKVKKITENQKAYSKERKRIQSFISRASKRGYIIPENILPETPKKVTAASVRRLKRITAESIYKKSRYVDQETGEILKGLAGRKAERSAAAKKAAATRKAKREAERDFWQGGTGATPTEPPIFLPDEISEEELNRIRFNNFYEQIRELLDIPITSYFTTDAGSIRRRKADVAAAAETARQNILQSIDTLLATHTKAELGERFNKQAEEINNAIDRLRFSSNSADVQLAYSVIMRIINSDNETLNRLANELQEFESDGWDLE